MSGIIGFIIIIIMLLTETGRAILWFIVKIAAVVLVLGLLFLTLLA